MIKTIIFDFDDTLLISEKIKHDAYLTIFSDLPNSESIIRAADMENFGKHRRVVIEATLQALIKAGLVAVSDLEKEINKRTEKFSQLVETEILKAAEVEGASLVLPQLAQKYRLYLNSGTPLDKLSSIITKKRWQAYFQGIYGRPGTKENHIQEIIAKEGCLPQEVVVVGDTQADWQAAVACGTHFIGIDNAYSQWPPNHNFPILENLISLLAVIAQF